MKAGYCLTSWVTIGFSKNILYNGVSKYDETYWWTVLAVMRFRWLRGGRRHRLQYQYMYLQLVTKHFTCQLRVLLTIQNISNCHRVIQSLPKRNTAIKVVYFSKISFHLMEGVACFKRKHCHQVCLTYWGSRVPFPTGAANFSLHHHVQNGSGAHPASYPMDTRGSFSGGKATGAWSWPLNSI
jgi:hypothetical protein